MSHIKAEPQYLCSVFLIKIIDALRCLFRMTAGPFHKMPAHTVIKVFDTYGYAHLLRQRSNRVYELCRFPPFQFFRTKETSELKSVNHHVWTAEKSTYRHTLRRHLIPQIIIYLFIGLLHINRIWHVHLVYCDSCLLRPLPVRHKKMFQFSHRPIKKII